MFWNATMPVWIALVFIMAFVALALYMAFVARRHALAGEYTAASKQRTIDALVVERDEERARGDGLSRERDILSHDLMEAQAEIERLNKPDLATLPLQEAVKPEPVEPPPGVSPDYLNKLEETFPPKHSPRKKRGAQ